MPPDVYALTLCTQCLTSWSATVVGSLDLIAFLFTELNKKAVELIIVCWGIVVIVVCDGLNALSHALVSGPQFAALWVSMAFVMFLFRLDLAKISASGSPS